MPDQNYSYPSLNEILPLEKIPQEFQGIQDLLTKLTEKLYYKEFYSSYSPSRHAGFIKLTLITPERLELELGGSNGVIFILNPSSSIDGSDIPLTLRYKWDILFYIREFEKLGFDSSPKAYLEIIFNILGIKKSDLIESLCIFLIGGANPLQQFITDFNNTYPNETNLVYNNGLHHNIYIDLALQLLEINVNVFEFIFNQYIDDLNTETAKARIKEIFSKFNKSIDFELIAKQLLIPRIYASLDSVKAAIKFPDGIFTPVDETISESLLKFNIGTLQYNSGSGLAFNSIGSLSFTTSYIGKTGLSIGFENAKLDLNENKNIPEADADERDISFKGVYVETATIGLPKEWTKDSGQQVEIVGRNLLIGNPGGLSGTISLESTAPAPAPGSPPLPAPVLTTTFAGGTTISLTKFEMVFAKTNEDHPNINIESSELIGSITFPGLKDSAGNPAQINVTGVYNNTEFSLEGSVANALKLSIPNFADFYINRIKVGRFHPTDEDPNGEFYFEISGRIEFNVSIPLVGKLLPESIDITNFRLNDEPKIEDFDVAVTWTGVNGFQMVAANGEVDLTVPVNKTIADVLTIATITGKIKQPDADPATKNLSIDIAGGLKLGPFNGVVSGVGIEGNIEYSKTEGNVGPLLFSDFKIKPPTGIGITIDGNGFKGGGFLSFDHEKGRYVGALELSIKDKISIKAVAIIVTKLPSGKDGFSLLLLITAEFQPISLGFGFTLNGVGGLIATHRTVMLDVLRDGLKSNTLDNILFPDDPVKRIDVIVADLEKVFPIKEGRHTFGIMALIGWGKPTLITAQIGLVLDVPSPIKLAIIGVIKALIPDENAKILRLQVNFLGILDFEKKFISFDASIFDSKLLTYTLSGDMAFRLKYGSDSNFLFTVGGFHPSFTPPPLNLPTINRLTLALLSGNPSVTLSCYFAVTSNTVQVGARADLSYNLGKYSVIGYIGFDALFQFSPFYFIIEAGAMFAVKKGSEVKLSISLNFKLSGPAPWNVAGRASFEICKIDFSVGFDKTWGDSADTSLPEISVKPLLLDALNNIKNWEAQNPESKSLMVSLRNTSDESDKILLHPFGILKISQKVVPLNISISKFGNQNPSGANKFVLQNLKVNGNTIATPGIVRDEFAPAQFFQLSDSQKLSRPSFEQMESGLMTQVSEEIVFSKYLHKDLVHEVLLLDKQDPQTPNYDPLNDTSRSIGTRTNTKTVFNAQIKGGAISKSSQSFTKKAEAIVQDKKVSTSSEKYAVVTKDDLSIYNLSPMKTSRAEAEALLKQIISSDPSLKNELQVVPEFEVNI